MGLTHRVTRYGGMRLARRLGRAVPFVGALIALATLGAAMRRKGVARGAMDTGLNAIPFLGGAKIGYELLRGRDIFPDRQHRARARG